MIYSLLEAPTLRTWGLGFLLSWSTILKKVCWIYESGRLLMTFGEWLVQVPQDLSFVVKGLPALGTTFFAH